MKPIYLTVRHDLPLMIIPDSQAHADGHPVLTYTYSIFRDKADPFEAIAKENKLHLSKNDDPDYFGFITFEQPGKLFSYTANGPNFLTRDEIQLLIEEINDYRDTPKRWML